MKLLNKKSFIMLMIGFAAYWLNQIANVVISVITIEDNINQTLSDMNMSLEEINMTMDTFKTLVLTVAIIGAVVSIGLSMIFFISALSHRKKPKTGGYLTVLMVFCIIFAGFSLISIISNPLGLINIAIYAIIIVAVFMQKSDKAPQFYQPQQSGEQGFAPYDQMFNQNNNPYQQNYYNQQQFGQPQTPFEELDKQNQNNNPPNQNNG